MDEAQERENAPGNKIILRNISRHIHTRHRYPGGPTRVPKNGKAVRYPGGPHGPPGYAMATWRLCARATRVNRHFDFVNEHEILFKYQFGFRKSYSSYLAITASIDKLVKSVETGDYVVGVFLDFSKAFDTVDHEILLSKLLTFAHCWYNSTF